LLLRVSWGRYRKDSALKFFLPEGDSFQNSELENPNCQPNYTDGF
jgi:hypothetical protein